VAKVKRFESGVVRDPITVPPQMKVRDVIALSRQHGISGFPVVEGAQLIGIVTNRDLRFESVWTRRCADHDAARTAHHRQGRHAARRSQGADAWPPLERVLVVNDAFELRGLITVKDITKQTEHPNAARDARQAARRARRSAWARTPKSASNCWCKAGRRRDRRRHRARPQQGRARARALGQEELPAGRRDRRQHRHRRRREGAGRIRRRRRQGRHRPGLDLHHAHRRRRRRAAGHGHRQRRDRAARARACR
jgi:CBS domain-containing protein